MRRDVSALDDQIRDSMDRVLESIRGRLESELSTCQDELVRAAQDAERASAEATANATAEMRESSSREMEEQRARFTAEVEDLQRRLNESREETQKIIEEHERRTEEGRQQLELAGRDLESARTELDATREDVEATLRDIEAARRDSDAARRELLELSEVLRRKDVHAAQASRLPEAVRALDESATFGHALENLARHAGQEAGRAAVFLVKGDRLLDWRTVGFDFASDAPRLDVALSDSGPMAEAVRSRQGIRLRGEQMLPEFARNGEIREAAAWPISVGGSVVAVLYADGPVADKPDELYWPVFLDVLAMHAGRVLEGITVRQAAGLMTGRPMGVSSSTSVGRQSSRSIQ